MSRTQYEGAGERLTSDLLVQQTLAASRRHDVTVTCGFVALSLPLVKVGADAMHPPTIGRD